MMKPLLNFRSKPEVAETIRAMAAEDRRPVSQFLANLVEDALAQRQSVSDQHDQPPHAA
jgi:hypothetical protein